jgi:hypothetical protein
VTAFFVCIFSGFGVVLGHLFKPVFKPKTIILFNYMYRKIYPQPKKSNVYYNIRRNRILNANKKPRGNPRGFIVNGSKSLKRAK